MKNPAAVIDLIISFIRINLRNTNGAVIGLSGGIDSALVAVLAEEALGKDKVDVLMLPYFFDKNIIDAKELISNLKINSKLVPIKTPVDSITKYLNLANTVTEQGNLMARERMAILYAYANKYGKRVLGTTNLTEKLIGYGTKYGDEAADHEPLAGLLKKYVYELAYYWNTLKGKPKIPEQILIKAPSAGLVKEDQTDENDLGMTYTEIDEILEYILINRLAYSLTNNYNIGYNVPISTTYLDDLNDPILKYENGKRITDMMLDSDHKRKGSNYPTIPVELLKN